MKIGDIINNPNPELIGLFDKRIVVNDHMSEERRLIVFKDKGVMPISYCDAIKMSNKYNIEL